MTDARSDALAGALADSNYLITPKARNRLWGVLVGDHSNEAEAARIILADGGQQQGIPAYNSYGTGQLGRWVEAVDTLESYCR